MFFEIKRINRILEELEEQIYSEKIDISNIRMKECGYGEYDLLDEDPKEWIEFGRIDRWGGKDCHAWFKFRVIIPLVFKDKKVSFEVKTGAEDGWDALNPQFLVYMNGEVIQGFDVNHRSIFLTEAAKGGEIYEFALFAYSGTEDQLVEFIPQISVYHEIVEKVFYDIKVPVEVAMLLEKEDYRRLDILNYLTDAINQLDLRQIYSDSYFTSMDLVSQYMDEAFYEKYCHPQDVVETVIGHTHIDVAWLWTLAQTREKTARSFSTVLSLMDQYPEYKFMSSQPQLYQYLKEGQPEMYEKVKERIAQGRWEAEGAMWLEADCNLISGESLVRQILYGKRFFKEEFNVESKVLWLPDVFGYSTALPQILRKCDVDYFMTTKISWNEYNAMPYDTFYWYGIDGTDILTYFITTQDYEPKEEFEIRTTYNGDTQPKQIIGAWNRYQQKSLNKEVLNCFGYGDGGGGPTKEMLENIRRMEKGIPGAPSVRYGSVVDFFERLEERIGGNRHVPKWHGELYLEYHRGTYTSMARNKKANRRTEFDNLDAEWLSMANQLVDKSYDYPTETLRKVWLKTLLNQFHDIIPGSSIKSVYEDSKADYEEIKIINDAIISKGLSSLASHINLNKDSIVVFNGLGFKCSDLVEVDLPKNVKYIRIYDGGQPLFIQYTSNNKVLFYATDIPSKGYKSFSYESIEIEDHFEDFGYVSEEKIDTPYYLAILDKQGNFTSIYDKLNERELLKEGQRGNVIQAFEDKPHDFDAWDINIYYTEKMWEVDQLESISVVEDGPLRKTIRLKRIFLDSILIQDIRVYKDIARIDFVNDIDWKETQILLKTAFPVEINSTKATYEIQYGNVERPTHWNTSWDYARFEVCAHKWADYAEGDYGIALMNDCKYGHDIHDGVMRLSLIKSAKHPNVDADRERHEFTYSIYPHKGDFRQGSVVQMAYQLNNSLYSQVVKANEGILESSQSFVAVDQENVILEVYKKSEEDNSIIIRMYECYNQRTKIICKLSNKFIAIVETNLIEKELKEIASDADTFIVTLKPYEIKTFKLKME